VSLLVRGAAIAGLALVAIGVAATGCDGAKRRRDCSVAVWVDTSVRSPSIVGTADGWSSPRSDFERYDDDHWLLRLEPAPGRFQYLIVGDDGEPYLDPNVPLSAFRESDETEVSLVEVPDCGVPLVAADRSRLDGTTLTVGGRFLSADDAAKLDPASLSIATEEGTSLVIDRADPEGGTWRAHAEGLSEGKHTFTVSARDGDGNDAEPQRVVALVGERARERTDQVIYQIMIDRYRGDEGAALAPPATLGSRAGGTLDGVRASIEDGSLDRIGVTTVWLSPVYRNPTGMRPGRDGHEYESYHGYWPADGRAVDDRIGGDAALRRVVEVAHAHGMRVILDLVPNHVDETNPLYAEHGKDGWFNPTGCVCGDEDCPWGEFIQSCWFASYLPDVHFQHDAAIDYAAEEARYWLDTFDVDGFRIDAVPMMPRAATRRIAARLRQGFEPASSPFLVGEVFTGPGVGGLGQIRAYLGPATLDSAFDFPLMWSLRDAIASGGGGFDDVDATLDASDEAFEGAGGAIAHMIDNHDVSRFASVAAGDDGSDPWVSPPIQSTDPDVYRRQALGMAALFTLPGVPTIYYGDEVGLAGASDPDSRRVMPAEADLDGQQRWLRAEVARLAALRRCSAALRGDERQTTIADRTTWAFVRGGSSEAPAIVVMSTASAPTTIELADVAASFPSVDFVDAATGDPVDLSDIAIEPIAFRVFVPAGSACAPVISTPNDP